jgi:hypothetical protein
MLLVSSNPLPLLLLNPSPNHSIDFPLHTVMYCLLIQIYHVFITLTSIPGDGFDLSLWSSFEYHLAIITACIPTIKPLWIRGIRKMLIIIRGGRISTSQESSETPRSKFVQPEPKFPV